MVQWHWFLQEIFYEVQLYKYEFIDSSMCEQPGCILLHLWGLYSWRLESRRRNITDFNQAIISCTYFVSLAFKISLMSSWAPHEVCTPCVEYLRRWKNGKKLECLWYGESSKIITMTVIFAWWISDVSLAARGTCSLPFFRQVADLVYCEDIRDGVSCSCYMSFSNEDALSTVVIDHWVDNYGKIWIIY